MATRKAKRGRAPAKRSSKKGRRPSACKLCEVQMRQQAKRLKAAQHRREQILLRRVKRSGGRRTGQRIGTTPTGLIERAVVLPQDRSYRGGGFRSVGASPYFSGRDASRGRSRSRDPRSRSREWTYSGPSGRSISLATRPERDYRRPKKRSRSRARDESRDWRTQPIRHARAAVLGWERRGNPYPRNPDKFTGKRRPPLFSPVKSYRKRHPKSRVGSRDFYAAAARDFYRAAPRKRKAKSAYDYRRRAPKKRRASRARDNYALDLRPRGSRGRYAGF